MDSLTEPQMLDLLRDHLKQWRSRRAFCLARHIDPGWLSHVLAGHNPVGPQIAHALGFRLETLYIPMKEVRDGDGCTTS